MFQQFQLATLITIALYWLLVFLRILLKSLLKTNQSNSFIPLKLAGKIKYATAKTLPMHDFKYVEELS